MNRFIFTLFLFCASLTLLQAQEINVPQTQRPLITKRTASWCPLCGGWGWTFFRNLIDDNKDKAVFFASHYDGIHTTPTTLALSANFGGVYQPIFFLNNQNQNVTSGNTAAARTSFQNQVNAAYATSPVVQSGFRAILNSAANTLTVQAKARFFQNASGEYYLGIYLVKKEFIGFQSGQGNNAEHKEVLSEHLTASPFGDLIGTGTLTAGTEANVNGEISVAGLDPTKLRVVSIIWKKEGNIYRVINANEDDNFLEPSATAEKGEQNKLKVMPSLIAEEGMIELQITNSEFQWRIELVAPTGQIVEKVFSGKLSSGKHYFTLHRSNRPAGLYFLRLSNGVQTNTQRLMFR